MMSHGRLETITLVTTLKGDPTMPEPEETQHRDEANVIPEATAANADSSENQLKPELSVSPNSIEGLFLQALQFPSPADREAFLDRSCQNDPEGRKRVMALLRAHAAAGEFMEIPAVDRPMNEQISLGFLKSSDKDGVLGTIGPYEVLEVIGRGGMGVVLRACDPKLNRIIAVKALLPELASNPNSRRRFLREAQAAAAINHPHVVSIHAVDDSDQDHNGAPLPPFLVMECIVGQSLQQKLDKVGPLRLTEILRISRQIADGLAAAHKQGLVHRDIKPANILLENGVERVKITDFGLARAIDDITVTRTGEVCGTPQYMSPEQACGDRVDHRSDLFSLGCVMYAMCTGHSPFRGNSIAHVIKRVTQDEPRSIAEQNPEIPLWLIEIVNSLLQKKSEHRLQSAADLAAILDKHLSRIQHPSESGSHSAINAIENLTPKDPKPEISSPLAGSTSENVYMQFGQIITQVPLESALNYATVTSTGRAWILLTLGGVVLSLVLHPTLSLAANTTQLVTQAFQFPASLLGIWIMSMLGTKIFTPSTVPLRTWALLSSTMFGCMAFGYFWTTVARMPFSGNLNEISSRSLMGAALIPTVIFLMYCSWVYIEIIKNPETLQGVRTLTGPQARLSNRNFIVLVTTVLLVLGLVGLLFKIGSTSSAKLPQPTVEVRNEDTGPSESAK
jgi:serine/threonine protein kinase